MFDLETNEHVQKAIDNRQMPKTEYRKINVEDYSKCSFSLLKGKASHLPCMAPQSSPGLTAGKASPPAPKGAWGWGVGRPPVLSLQGGWFK